MSKKAMKLMLDNAKPSVISPGWTLLRNEDITALREALEEPTTKDFLTVEQPTQQPTNCRHCGGADNVLCAGQCKEQPSQPASEEELKRLKSFLLALPEVREARSAQQQQKPVGVVAPDPDRVDWLRDEPEVGDLLYASPPASKQWVGLTPEQKTVFALGLITLEPLRVIEDIEAKLKEKNT